MSLKRPFVPKSDVKQIFTTTTYVLKSNGGNIAIYNIMVVIAYVLKSNGGNVAAYVITTIMLEM